MAQQHILIIDDEAHITRIAQVNLQRNGFRVTTARDGVEAWSVIQSDRPDLVLTDITMPRMDGIELLRRMKADEALKDIPVVIVSAKAQDEDVFEGKRSGAEQYLNKPFNPVELVRVVNEVLEGKGGDAGAGE